MNLPKHELTMTVLMTPDMANFSGKVHGGALLNLLDRVAFSCASRYSGRYAVTLSVDQVVFKEPINVGELVTFRAAVNLTANIPHRAATDTGKLVFRKYGRVLVLREMWRYGASYGHELITSKAEKEIAQKAATSSTLEVVSMR